MSFLQTSFLQPAANIEHVHVRQKYVSMLSCLKSMFSP